MHGRSAVRHFEQALALDLKFGSAAAELAWVYQNAQWVESQAAALGVSHDEAVSKAAGYFEQAANYPSPTYYQLLSKRLSYEQKSDEAIAAAERALALDASDPNNYLQLSFALIIAGRATDGRGFLDAAMRVDPGWSRRRYYLAGLAYFSVDRFEEAAASLEKLDLQSRGTGYWDFWSNYNGLKLLISAYGHLGRSADIAVARKSIEPYLAEADHPEHTGLLGMGEFPFKNYADFERVLQGLRKAGVPELPFGFDPRSKDRLDGAAIKALLFGHKIKGRAVDTGDTYSRTTAADGTSSWSDKGISRIEGDTMCSFLPPQYRTCLAVFRNPKGTFAQKNEYLIVSQRHLLEFSVVK
jgi:tetratricopeptide (TPR) repeat protein